MAIPVGFFLAHLLYQPVAGTHVSTIGVGLDWVGAGPIPTPIEAAEIVDTAATGVSSIATGSFMGSDWKYLGASVTYQDEVGPLTGQFDHVITGAGTAGSLPPNCAILVSKQTGLGGRRNRGRVYLPPVYPAETIVDSLGIINPTSVGLLGDRFAAFDSALFSAEFQTVLFHDTAPFTPTPVTGWVVSNLLATQRRRMRP